MSTNIIKKKLSNYDGQTWIELTTFSKNSIPTYDKKNKIDSLFSPLISCQSKNKIFINKLRCISDNVLSNSSYFSYYFPDPPVFNLH